MKKPIQGDGLAISELLYSDKNKSVANPRQKNNRKKPVKPQEKKRGRDG